MTTTNDPKRGTPAYKAAFGHSGYFTCESCYERHEAPDDGPRRYRGHPLCEECYNDTVGGVHALRTAGVI